MVWKSLQSDYEHLGNAQQNMASVSMHQYQIINQVILCVSLLKQFQLMKNISFVQPAWNMGFKLLLTTFIVHEECVVISDGLVPGQCDSFLL